MKLRLLVAAIAALAVSGASFAQSAAAPAASTGALPTAPDKNLVSYALGYKYGRELVDTKADLDLSTIIRALQDGYAKRDPAMPGDKLGQALEAFQTRMESQARAEFDSVVRDNKSKSDAFLSANRGKPGVVVLPSGVQYRVIEPGTGAKPVPASTVSIHYRGSLATTGQEFANTYSGANPQPANFRLSDFPVKGVQDVLVMMPMGSRWEIYLPAEKGFGNDPRSPVGPAQALVFDIKLVSVK